MFEGLVLRSVPGIINLIALLLLGDWLALSDYGLFSTAIAVTGFVALMVFGPLMSAVLSQYAIMVRDGHGADYESSYISLTLLFGAVAVVAGYVAVFLNVMPAEWVPAIFTFGVYSAFQELLRAQLRSWAYGIASVGQSLLYLALVMLIVPTHRDPSWVLNLFSASYAAAALLSLALLRFPRLKIPNFPLMKPSLHIGGGYLGSTLGEQLIYVGMRYVILGFGNAQQLGIFSFAVDLAQRTVGFLINAASFVFIPLAFHRDAHDSKDSFGKTLRNGAIISTALSLAAFVVILLIRELNLILALHGPMFDPIAFAIISLAIVMNRLKKLLADPYAMRAQRPFGLIIGYAVGAPAALVAGALAYRAGSSHFGAASYLLGYLLATLITVAWLRSHMRRSAKTGPSNAVADGDGPKSANHI